MFFFGYNRWQTTDIYGCCILLEEGVVRPVFFDGWACQPYKYRKTHCIFSEKVTQYRSEIIKASYRFLKSSINEDEVVEMDKVINQRSREGWELVAYSFMGGSGGDIGKGILITFKKE